nr:LysR family transcriptional regulator [Clostridium sp. Marseille-P7770]
MNLKEQLYVCTLAETGNITQAAKLLFISQPALSLYISNLENILGIRLFERIGKSFVLTQAGELYVEKASQMLKLKESFDYDLSEIVNGQDERLRVGIQDIRSHFLTPIILPKMDKMYPRTKLVWMEGNYTPLEQMLLNNELDIFFCNCNTLCKDFEYIPLLNDEVVFIVHKDHPLCDNAQISSGHTFPYINLKLFENERFLLLNESQSLRKYSDQVLKICNVFPKNIFLLKKIFIMINLVNIGYGVGFSLAGYIDRSAHIENLRIFSVVNPPVTATFYAVYKKGKHLTKAALSLIDMVKMSVNEQFPFI